MSNTGWSHRQQPIRLPCPWDSPGKNTGVGCHFLPQWMKVKSESEDIQSCPSLSDPMDCSLPGFSVHGIFQARVLEWGAIAFSDIRHYLASYQSNHWKTSSATIMSFKKCSMIYCWNHQLPGAGSCMVSNRGWSLSALKFSNILCVPMNSWQRPEHLHGVKKPCLHLNIFTWCLFLPRFPRKQTLGQSLQTKVWWRIVVPGV